MSNLAYIFSISLAVGLFSSCNKSHLNDEQVTDLLVGSWDTETTHTANEGDTTIEISASGHQVVSADGTWTSEQQSKLKIFIPEGAVDINYRASMSGDWFIEDGILSVHRIHELIEPLDEFSKDFINREDFKKLQETNDTSHQTYAIDYISTSKYMITDQSTGLRTRGVRSLTPSATP